MNVTLTMHRYSLQVYIYDTINDAPVLPAGVYICNINDAQVLPAGVYICNINDAPVLPAGVYI